MGSKSRLKRQLARDRLLDQLCDRFEADLRSGGSPRLEDYLDQVEEADRPALFEALLAVALSWPDPGGACTRESLVARFPAWVEFIDRLLDEKTPPLLPLPGLEPHRTAEASADEAITGRAPYRRVRAHGAGALGVVYEALDEELERRVALKELHTHLSADSNLRKRFVFEAKVTGTLEHPGIVPVYAACLSGGESPYFVSRFVEGVSLAEEIELLHKEPLWLASSRGRQYELKRLLRRFLSVCETVAYAHSRGIVHRDLKPDHILFGPFGETVVIDWGLAKSLAPEDGLPHHGPVLAAAWDRGDRTSPGDELGTPIYSSPEQARGDHDTVGPASDIYSLGAVLYEVLTGAPPFDPALPVNEIRKLVASGTVRPPRSVSRRIPKKLDAICLKAMAPEPGRRYASALDLADDLERWLDGESVSVHPDGMLVRLFAWARRHRLASGVVIGAVTLSLGLAGVTGLRWALARARIEPVVAQIEAAPLDRVAELSEELRAEGATARAVLRDRLSGADAAGKRSIALALAGVSEKDGDVLSRMLASDPAFRRELVTAMTDRSPVGPPASLRLEQLLQPFGSLLVEDLLAKEADVIAGDPGRWDVARGVLLRFVSTDRLDVLARCLADATDEEFRDILSRMRSDPDGSRRALRGALAGEQDLSPFRPIDPAWSEPDPTALATIEGARGVVAPGFLACLSLPLEEFDRLSDALRPSGYRPLRLRPYVAPGGRELWTAAIWTRDGARYATVHGMDAESITRLDESRRKAGLVPIDIAISPAPATREPRYGAVWVEVDAAYHRAFRDRARTPLQAAWLGGRLPDARLVVGIDWDRARADEADRYESRWWNAVSQFLRGPDGAMHVAQVREEDGGFERSFDVSLGDAGSLPDWEAHGLFQNDVCLDAGSPGAASSALMVTSREPGWFASKLLYGLDPDALLGEMRELASGGYHPHSVSVQALPDGGLKVASLWKNARMHPHRGGRELRSARLAIALARLGEREPLWALLRHGPDPTVRTHLIGSAARLGLPMEVFLERFPIEPDTSVRRAILLALGSYEPVPATHPFVTHVLEIVRAEEDAGLRSAATWLLGEWGLGEARDVVIASAPRGSGPATPEYRWFINPEGQTFSVIRKPVSFTMGEPMWDMTDERLTMPHRVRIDRDFAIGTTEVTRKEFRTFREEMARGGRTLDGRESSRFGRNPEGPVLGVSFFDAARYCNWLSEREGLPRSQWCFEEDETGGLRLAPGYLTRTGYRLPTEAEWEYACRAGSTAPRPFGRTGDTAVMRQYAWYIDGGARNHAWPAGRLMPNDLGLFDMLGNAHEWCLDARAAYCQERCDRELADVESSVPLTREGNRILRGGWFNMPANGLTSSHRSWSWAATAHSEVGFRLARTLP